MSVHWRAWLLVLLLTTGMVGIATGCGDDDGGNDNSNNGHDAGPTTECGNGEMEGLEECDDGADNSDTRADACRTNCELPACGDGVTDNSEACDEGPQNSDIVPDACRSDCEESDCGDGVVDVMSGETCDDGNDLADDGCSPNCLVEHCGNGVVDPGEICDDGNIQGGDGCSPSCASDESCGNGIVDLLAATAEQCDDGNVSDGDGCSPTCQIEVCGNGNMDPGEVCDDGNLDASDGCSPDCRSDESCGNSYPDFLTGEQCDDGNHRSHDGCSSGCTGEFPLWTRYTEPIGAITDHSMAYDSDRDRLVVFGGSGFCGPFCDKTFEHDGVRWRLMDTPNRPPSRRRAMMAYDSIRGVTVLFGGDRSSFLDDTWEYDGNDWVQVTTANAPVARSWAAMAYDNNRGVVVLFGGEDGNGDFGDTWEYNGVNWVQQSPAASPPSRSNARAVYDSQRQVVVLVSGAAAGLGTQDTWEYDGTSWSLATTATWWRTHHGLAYDVARGITVAFSGFVNGVPWCAEPLCGDLLEYGGGAWTQAATPLSGPEARRGHAMGYHAGLGGVVLLGGADNDNVLFDDTWLWDGTDWLSLSEGRRPEPRDRHALVYDTVHYTLVMFGGSQGSSDSQVAPHTWLFEDGGWRRLTCVQTTDCPAARSGHAMVWDSARERAVLFGGGFSSGGSYTAFDDTWEFDGTTWIEKFPATSPPARTMTAMAYNPVEGRVVLFGGSEESAPNSTAFDDTWEYDGTNWALVPTTNPPPARGVHVMTWDASNQEVVMMGGVSVGFSGLTDTWTYDGTDWTEKVLALAPAARGRPVLVFDPLRRRTVLYGGITLTGYLDDSWEWDGTHWTQLFANPPAARGFAAAAYHVGLSQVAVYGGYNGAPLGDLYFFQYSSQWPEEVCDSGQDVDEDGDIDCVDPDCEGQTCATGMVCTAGACVTP